MAGLGRGVDNQGRAEAFQQRVHSAAVANVKFVMAELFGVSFQTVLDAIVQRIQIWLKKRKTWDWNQTAGQALIERGRAGSGLFVLEQGQAVVEAPEGTRELGPGDVFGERSLLGEDGERTARVRAQTDVRCLAIARTELERLIAERPGLGERLRQLSD